MDSDNSGEIVVGGALDGYYRLWTLGPFNLEDAEDIVEEMRKEGILAKMGWRERGDIVWLWPFAHVRGF